MNTILAALMAAALGFGINRCSVRIIGRRAITLSGPASEELSKTGFAVLLGASLVCAHFLFGAIEALYDVSKGGQQAMPAAVLSIVSHTLFGYVTAFAAARLDSWHAGVLVAILVHSLWNRTVMAL